MVECTCGTLAAQWRLRVLGVSTKVADAVVKATCLFSKFPYAMRMLMKRREVVPPCHQSHSLPCSPSSEQAATMPGKHWK